MKTTVQCMARKRRRVTIVNGQISDRTEMNRLHLVARRPTCHQKPLEQLNLLKLTHLLQEIVIDREGDSAPGRQERVQIMYD